ncbi:MAG: metalloregulator ArsR/SmtB family transcription factor [Vitreimonas sp.]
MREPELTALFGALADPTRRAILTSLRRGALPVHELAHSFEISRPAVSKHLAVLRKAGLVSEERRGRENIYTLERQLLKDAQDWFGEFWRGRLSALKKLAEDGR